LVSLGGCTMIGDAPQWSCRGCGHTWRQLMPAPDSDFA
jgi:hypothetical protein